MAAGINPVPLSFCYVTWAGLHRLSSFQLMSPKRLSVLRVNSLVLAAYDSDTDRLNPRNRYSPEDQQFWSEIGTWYRAWDSWVETEYRALVEEIKTSSPQAEPYCDMHDATGAARVITRYALNGEDVLWYQSEQNRWVSVHPAAWPVAELWNEKEASFDVMNVHTAQQCHTFTGITAPFSAQQTAQPTAHVTQARPYHFICHVMGFYPHNIEVTWERRWGLVAMGEQLTHGVLPNADPTFHIQVSIELGKRGAAPQSMCVW